MIDEYIPSLKKETVTIEKKVYDVLQKNNQKLMQKIYELNKLIDELSNHLENAKEALRFYADINNYDDVKFIQVEDKGHFAREILREIEE